MRLFSTTASPRYSAAHTATLCLALFARGVQSRSAGYCLGQLRSKDVSYVSGQLVRVEFSSQLQRAVISYRMRAHLRRGHDLGCRTFGVPIETSIRLCREWGGPGAAQLISDALNSSAKDLMNTQHSSSGVELDPEHIFEVLTDEISIRVVPKSLNDMKFS